MFNFDIIFNNIDFMMIIKSFCAHLKIISSFYMIYKSISVFKSYLAIKNT